MATNEIMLLRESLQTETDIGSLAEKPAHKAPGKGERAKARKTAAKSARPKKAAAKSAPGNLPILYMLSPQKFMSPFDCNIAADSGYKIVLPYENVTTADVEALVQDAIFSRPPRARTGVFIGGKNIRMAIEMMSAARKAMRPCSARRRKARLSFRRSSPR